MKWMNSEPLLKKSTVDLGWSVPIVEKVKTMVRMHVGSRTNKTLNRVLISQQLA